MWVPFSPDTNGTHIVLNCYVASVSVRVARGLHHLILFGRRLTTRFSSRPARLAI